MVFPDLTRDRSVFKSPAIIQITKTKNTQKIGLFKLLTIEI